MKKRLSDYEYLALAREIRAMRDNYWRAFRIMTGHFPKNGRAIRRLLALNIALMNLDYQVETEFFKDFPDKKLSDYRFKEED